MMLPPWNSEERGVCFWGVRGQAFIVLSSLSCLLMASHWHCPWQGPLVAVHGEPLVPETTGSHLGTPSGDTEQINFQGLQVCGGC